MIRPDMALCRQWGARGLPDDIVAHLRGWGAAFTRTAAVQMLERAGMLASWQVPSRALSAAVAFVRQGFTPDEGAALLVLGPEHEDVRKALALCALGEMRT